MKNKGFTLIELLAVIVILAVIALIAIPLIANVIETSKLGAVKDSAYGLMSSSEVYLANSMKHGISENESFICAGNECRSDNNVITFKGNINAGVLLVSPLGETMVCVDDGEHYALKYIDETEVISGNGVCADFEGTFNSTGLRTTNDNWRILLSKAGINWQKYKSLSDALTNDNVKKIADEERAIDYILESVKTGEAIFNEIVAKEGCLDKLTEEEKNLLAFYESQKYMNKVFDNEDTVKKIIDSKELLIELSNRPEILMTLKDNDKYKDVYVPLFLSSTTLTEDEKYQYGYPLYLFSDGLNTNLVTQVTYSHIHFGSNNGYTFQGNYNNSRIYVAISAQYGSCSDMYWGSSKTLDFTKYVRLSAYVGSWSFSNRVSGDGAYETIGNMSIGPEIVNVRRPETTARARILSTGRFDIDVKEINQELYPSFMTGACAGGSTKYSYSMEITKWWLE